MAFGKDQRHLANIPAYGGSFVQKARTAARRPVRSGGGGAPYWKDTYKPPEFSPGIIRLVRGDYVQQMTYDGETVVEDTYPFYIFREHHNGQRGSICSGGPLWASRGKSLPCPPCTIYWEDVNERKAKKARGDNTRGPNRMSCREQFAFTVWDYAPYFEVPDVDGNGQYRMNPKTNMAYTHWETGNPNDPKYQNKPWKQGHLLAWPMGITYHDALAERDKLVGQSCLSCGTRDSIRCVMKICGNPQCGQFIYDPQNCTLTDEQRNKIDSYPHTCNHCQQTTFIDDVIECSVCQQPKHATLFDVDLQVQRMGTAGQQTFLQIFAHSEPRPIQVADPEVLKTIVPLDLAKKFAPTPPERASQMFNIAVVGQQPTQPPAMMATPVHNPMTPQLALQAPPTAPQPGVMYPPNTAAQPAQSMAVVVQQPFPAVPYPPPQGRQQ